MSKSPSAAPERADLASRGREVRTTEADMVSGRSAARSASGIGVGVEAGSAAEGEGVGVELAIVVVGG